MAAIGPIANSFIPNMPNMGGMPGMEQVGKLGKMDKALLSNPANMMQGITDGAVKNISNFPGASEIANTPKISPVIRGSQSRAPGFGDMIGSLVAGVDAKGKAAQAEVRDVFSGKSNNIHRSTIALQESSLAFSLLVEVRNKLTDSYQELMRMQV